MVYYPCNRRVKLSNIYWRSERLPPLLSYVMITFYQHFLKGGELIKIVCNDPWTDSKGSHRLRRSHVTTVCYRQLKIEVCKTNFRQLDAKFVVVDSYVSTDFFTVCGNYWFTVDNYRNKTHLWACVVKVSSKLSLAWLNYRQLTLQCVDTISCR